MRGVGPSRVVGVLRLVVQGVEYGHAYICAPRPREEGEDVGHGVDRCEGGCKRGVGFARGLEKVVVWVDEDYSCFRRGEQWMLADTDEERKTRGSTG